MPPMVGVQKRVRLKMRPPRPRRQRRQQLPGPAKLAAELAGTDRRRIVVSASVAQAKANPTRDLAIVHVQVPAQLPTPRTHPVGLLAVDALLPDNLKRLRRAVDEQRDFLARDPHGWRARR